MAGGARPDLALNVVEVREIDAPENVEPLHWILLTSLSCEKWVDVRRIIARYTQTLWWIEEYHKALKSGTKIEDSQMGERLSTRIVNGCGSRGRYDC